MLKSTQHFHYGNDEHNSQGGKRRHQDKVCTIQQVYQIDNANLLCIHRSCKRKKKKTQELRSTLSPVSTPYSLIRKEKTCTNFKCHLYIRPFTRCKPLTTFVLVSCVTEIDPMSVLLIFS